MPRRRTVTRRASCGTSAAPAQGASSRSAGRALERRAPCSRAAAASSRSGGALLAYKPAAERAAWAGRAPARQRTNERQGGMACARARYRPGAKLGLSSAHLKAPAQELGRVDSSIYTSVVDADGELILRGSDLRRRTRSNAGRWLNGSRRGAGEAHTERGIDPRPPRGARRESSDSSGGRLAAGGDGRSPPVRACR